MFGTDFQSHFASTGSKLVRQNLSIARHRSQNLKRVQLEIRKPDENTGTKPHSVLFSYMPYEPGQFSNVVSSADKLLPGGVVANRYLNSRVQVKSEGI